VLEAVEKRDAAVEIIILRAWLKWLLGSSESGVVGYSGIVEGVQAASARQHLASKYGDGGEFMVEQ